MNDTTTPAYLVVTKSVSMAISLVSAIGAAIVIINFLPSKGQSRRIVRRTIVNLSISDFLLSTSYFLLVLLSIFQLNEYNWTETKDFVHAYTIIGQLTYMFEMTSSIWTVCVSVSLLMSTRNTMDINSSPSTARNTEIFFHLLCWLVPLAEATAWTYFSFTKQLEQTWMSKSFYYMKGGVFFMLGLVNIVLLIFIRREIKQYFSSRNPTTTRVLRGRFTTNDDSVIDSSESESLVSVNKVKENMVLTRLSRYPIPWLLSVTWLIIWCFYYPSFELTSHSDLPWLDTINDVLLEICRIFIPMQGLLNCIVFGINSDSVQKKIKRICCCGSRSGLNYTSS